MRMALLMTATSELKLGMTWREAEPMSADEGETSGGEGR